MTEDVKWATPAGRQQAGAAHRTAEMLKGRPGDWAIIEDYPVPTIPDGADEDEKARLQDQIKKIRAKASSRASLIKQGRVAAFRSDPNEGVFTAVSRSEVEGGEKVLRVYAVYLVGDDAAQYLADQEQKKAAKAAAKDGSGAEAELVSVDA